MPMPRLAQQILGESPVRPTHPGHPMGRPPRLARFNSQPVADLMTDENDTLYDQLYDELIDPLIDSYEVRGIGPSEVIELMQGAAAGRVIAYEVDGEFINFLSVPLTEWRAAITEFKRRLRAGG